MSQSARPLLRAAAVRNSVAQNARMAPRNTRQASSHGATASAEQYPAEGETKLHDGHEYETGCYDVLTLLHLLFCHHPVRCRAHNDNVQSPLNLARSRRNSTPVSIQTGFSGPFWRNSLIALILSYTAYKVSAVYGPAAQGADIDHSHDPNETPTEASDKSMPFLTRYLAYHMPREGLWKENSDKRLIAAMKEAEDNHLIRDAQRPIMHRLRYPGMFEQASPHCRCSKMYMLHWQC